jgi:hypothetical protein
MKQLARLELAVAKLKGIPSIRYEMRELREGGKYTYNDVQWLAS